MMMNHGLTFRLPDEPSDHNVPTSYPQFFNNDMNDNDSDGDIHTVKTNTSLTLHSIEEPNNNGSFPESSFDIPITTTHVIQEEEDDDDVCAADDEREISFRSMSNSSSRIINDTDPYTILNRSVRPKNKCIILPPNSKDEMYHHHHHRNVEHKRNNNNNNSSLHVATSDWQVTELNDPPPLLPRIITPTISISRTATTTTSSSQTSQSDQNISNRYIINEDLEEGMHDVERPADMKSTEMNHAPAMSNQQQLPNTAEVDNNWIKTSWSYLQMMAKMASSPIKFSNNNIVDLDDTIVSSTNNTQTNTINDIVSVNGTDDQLTYDSSMFRNHSHHQRQDGTILHNQYSMKDDTSTLPSADSTNDYFNVNSTALQQQQQNRASTISLSDPIKMSHAGTRSTLFVAFGSNDNDDDNSNIKSMDDDDDSKKNMLPKTMNQTQDISRGSKVLSTEQQQRRRKRCICWIGSIVVILVLAFLISELVCVFTSCQHLGFIPLPSRRSSDENKSPNNIPVSPKTTPITPPSTIPVNTTITDLPTVSPSIDDPVINNPPTSATTAPSSVLNDPPTSTPILPSSPMPIVSMNVTTKLVLNTTEELYNAVDQYLMMYDENYNVSSIALLPPINEWDVSQIYNMSYVFSALRNPNAQYFNTDLHLWNTSNVVYMRSMFYQAENFNGNIITWDTSHVIDMYQTFTSAYQFNQDISMWNVSNAQEMSNMFLNCAQFNQNIGLWNTQSAISMHGMFQNAPSFNQDLYWNTARVIEMSQMFEDADSFDGDVSTFNTSLVRDMHNMFRNAYSFTGKNGLASWETYNLEDTTEMFLGATSFVGIGLSSWTLESLTSPNLMFAGATKFNQDLCMNWHDALMQLSGTRNMFAGTSCPDEEIPDPIYPDRSNTFCVSCATQSPIPVTTPPPSTGNTFLGKPFVSTEELRRAVDAYMLDDTDSSYVAFQYGYPIGVWDVSQLTDFSQIFDATRNTNILNFNADLSGWNVSKAVNMYAMFQQAVSFTDVNNGLALWDVSKVTDMSSMFASSAFAGNIAGWNVGNVIDFSFFADFASSFTSDVSLWNVSSAIDMSWMFRASKTFNSNIANWNVQKVKDFSNMFSGASTFNQNLCSWGQQLIAANLTSIDVIEIRNMFAATSCPYVIEWNKTSQTSGPWCTPC